jgi:hypothetical protein
MPGKQANVGVQRTSDIFQAWYRSYEKWAAKDLCASKAANVSHFFERRGGRFQFPASRFHPQRLNIPSGRFGDFLSDASKIARTHGWTENFVPRLCATQARRPLRLRRPRAGASKVALNWDCPPGRGRKTTIICAICKAGAPPTSSSTSARDRSIPAVTPAEVKRFLSLT